jgi:catechol 2,3-dioxygenase
MKISALGHVVLRVSDLERAERFYGDVLGLPLCARYDENGLKMAFFTLGNHHDFAVMQADGPIAPATSGLFHVAFKIGDNLDQLREAKAKLEAAGLAVMSMDHEVTKSIYFTDPDGNGIELYVDASDIWRREPGRVARAVPMEL